MSQCVLRADYTKQIKHNQDNSYNLLVSVDDYRYKDSLIHDE